MHVGVSGVAKCVYVEKLAYNHQFRRPDNAGQYLEKGSCSLTHNGKANVLRTQLNVDKIVQAVNLACVNCVASSNEGRDKPLDASKVSKNVGGFLCGYIYLNSLDVDCQRSLFVHVPPIDQPFSTRQTADIIHNIIEQCLQQLAAVDCKWDTQTSGQHPLTLFFINFIKRNFCYILFKVCFVFAGMVIFTSLYLNNLPRAICFIEHVCLHMYKKGLQFAEKKLNVANRDAKL